MFNELITWVEIDLDAIAYNVHAYKQFIGEQVELIAVVKANAYGHGLVQVAKTALASGASRLAVHRYYEGSQLRKSGVTAPILVMGATPIASIPEIIAWQLTPTIISEQFVEQLSEESLHLHVITPVHVKVDTGMSRFGLLPEEIMGFFQKIATLKGIIIEGFYTHFATADALDKTFLLYQFEVFNKLVELLNRNGFAIPFIHACNSAAAMTLSQAHYQAIRPGIGLYGLLPSTEWKPVFPIKPALTLKSKITRVREIPAGSSISYGRTHTVQGTTKVALVPIGYGDGYPRILSNKGYVLVKGFPAPILGRVCMDQCIVDITLIPDVGIEDEVILIGNQGENTISAEEVATHAGTINYEITTCLLPRVTRIYLRNGECFIGEEQFY